MATSESRLRADLQQFFGVCLDDMGRTVSVRHVAALAANLPRGARLLEEFDPSLGWTIGEHILFSISNSLREEPQPYPWEADGGRDLLAVDIEEYERLINLPRREA